MKRCHILNYVAKKGNIFLKKTHFRETGHLFSWKSDIFPWDMEQSPGNATTSARTDHFILWETELIF